jgi:predicted nucleic acid-binding protein
MADQDAAAAWIERNAAQVRRALADPAVRAELLALLDGHEQDRVRRLEAARAELADLEVHWRLEEPWED